MKEAMTDVLVQLRRFTLLAETLLARQRAGQAITPFMWVKLEEICRDAHACCQEEVKLKFEPAVRNFDNDLGVASVVVEDAARHSQKDCRGFMPLGSDRWNVCNNFSICRTGRARLEQGEFCDGMSEEHDKERERDC